MRGTYVLAVCLLSTVTVSAQQCNCGTGGSCSGGYAGGYAGGGFGGGGFGGGAGQSQLYPYDQQDTWLHGQYQRVPSYGGYNSFRPYNYRHVASQGQIAANWGGVDGMPYSQQFWNKYRASYLNQNLYSQTEAAVPDTSVSPAATAGYSGDKAMNPFFHASYNTAEQLLKPTSAQGAVQAVAPATGTQQPLHIYPVGTFGR